MEIALVTYDEKGNSRRASPVPQFIIVNRENVIVRIYAQKTKHLEGIEESVETILGII